MVDNYRLRVDLYYLCAELSTLILCVFCSTVYWYTGIMYLSNDIKGYWGIWLLDIDTRTTDHDTQIQTPDNYLNLAI